ncbi:MAG: hypothetical protein LUC83_05300 [Clostridiales bacterium]|nr:hypothetical protein [Clostridiales bacterium]
MNYEYQMAGIRVLLDLPFEISIQPSSESFITKPADEKPDMRFVCRPVSELPDPPKGGHEESNRCYAETGMEKQVFFRPSPEGNPYACVTWRAAEPNLLCCDYLAGQEQRLNFSMRLCDMLGLESLLLRFGGFLLHSAFIRWQGRGILFSTDSGVGKSTQADLWVKYQGAEILNGDRAGLRKTACSDHGRREEPAGTNNDDNHNQEGSVWAAYGLPYAGSSRIYRNESAPVSAVFMLEQAPVNELALLTPAQALRKIYPQITIHGWDADYVQRILPLIEDFLTSVPVYLLRCLPDEEATELAKTAVLALPEKGNI